MPGWLAAYLPDAAQWPIYVALAAVFGAVVLIVFGANALAGGRSMRSRLGEASPGAQASAPASRGSLRLMDGEAGSAGTAFLVVVGVADQHALPTSVRL